MQLENDRVFSRLAKAESEQVTSFAKAPTGKSTWPPQIPGRSSLSVLSWNPKAPLNPNRSTLASSHAGDGSLGGAKTPQARASNSTCVAATPPTREELDRVVRPVSQSQRPGSRISAARFVQWKAVLHGGANPPDLSWIELAYLPKNVAPQITSIAIQNPGTRVSGFGQQSGPPQPSSVVLRMPAAPGAQGASDRNTESPRYEPPPQGYAQKGYQSVLWNTEDANDDELTYSVYYRGENEKDWKLLKDKLDQKFYSWDTNSMPDGAYYLKIVASDERVESARSGAFRRTRERPFYRG